MDWIDFAGRKPIDKVSATLKRSASNRRNHRKNFDSFRPVAASGVRFSAQTEKWILRNHHGEVMIVDKRVIAALLLNKRGRLPVGANAKKILEICQNSFQELTPSLKDAWMVRAQKIFSACRKEFHAKLKKKHGEQT